MNEPRKIEEKHELKDGRVSVTLQQQTPYLNQMGDKVMKQHTILERIH